METKYCMPRSCIWACIVSMMITACSSSNHSNPTPFETPTAVLQPATLDVPLRRGFYVSSDTACEQASNATLGLLHARGLNSARNDCVFISVQPAGNRRYRIVERCGEIGSEEAFFTTSLWEILSYESFRRDTETGRTSEMRYCKQGALPVPWQGIDLRSAILRQ